MRLLSFVYGGNIVSINYVEDFYDEQIVARELRHLADAMVQNLRDIDEGKTPNVFSMDPGEDAVEIVRLIDALSRVIKMYEAPRAFA